MIRCHTFPSNFLVVNHQQDFGRLLSLSAEIPLSSITGHWMMYQYEWQPEIITAKSEEYVTIQNMNGDL